MKRLLSSALLGALLLAGCSSYQGASVQDTASSNRISDAQIQNAEAAANAYNAIHITHNSELTAIQKYVAQMTKPGALGYVVLFTLGRPIARYAVAGPVVDCARELTPMQHPAAARIPITGSNTGSWTTHEYTADSPNDEGTYGGNEHCHFFYTEDGRLIRWTGEFLYSDQPVRITETPLVIEAKSGH